MKAWRLPKMRFGTLSIFEIARLHSSYVIHRMILFVGSCVEEIEHYSGVRYRKMYTVCALKASPPVLGGRKFHNPVSRRSPATSQEHLSHRHHHLLLQGIYSWPKFTYTCGDNATQCSFAASAATATKDLQARTCVPDMFQRIL